MDKLDKNAIQTLLEGGPAPAVTIYLPMHTTAAPPHITENQIRFKNAVNEAVQLLRDQDERHPLAARLEDLIDQHYDDLDFWSKQTAGMLVCATADNVQMFHLPIDTEEYVSVDEQFYLAPLLGLLEDERSFHVLMLSQHSPRLYSGSLLYGLTPSKLELPESIEAALNIDEPNMKTENQGSARGSSLNTSWFNGRGGAKNPQEEDRMQFFRILDKMIYSGVDRNIPLLLAGIDSEIAEYRGISKHPHILTSSLAGNYKDQSLADIFEKVRPIIWQELVETEHKSVIEEYFAARGATPERADHDANNIAKAAEQGRVDKLLARFSAQTRDTVRDQDQEVMRITFPDQDEGNLINRIALKVCQNSGKVLNLLPQEMPDGALVLARYRY